MLLPSSCNHETLDFPTIAEKALPTAIDPKIFSWCPTMDLFALLSHNNSNIFIYRINGQRVWNLSIRNSTIKELLWKPDGKSLALITADGICKLYDSNNGKLITTIDNQNQHKNKNENLSDNNNNDDNIIEIANWDIRLKPLSNVSTFENLFNIDVSKSLPNLSILPNASTESIFTTKLAIDGTIKSTSNNFIENFSKLNLNLNSDSMLNSLTDSLPNSLSSNQISNEDQTDLLILVYKNLSFDITIFGLFNIGKVNYFSSKDFQIIKVLNIISINDLQNHLILSVSNNNDNNSQDDKKYLSILKLNLNFISLFKNYLNYVALNFTKILAILKYIKESISLIKNDCAPFLEFNLKLISILNDKFDNNSTSIIELYNLLLTGMMNDSLKDWLQNDIGEKNLKKWIRLGTVFFDNIRKNLFIFLTQALIRLLVYLSNLNGLAKWEERGSPLGLNPTFFNSCIHSISKLLRKIYNFILKINNIQNLFDAFMTWLGFIINQLNSSDPIYDSNQYVKTLDIANYITKYLNNSNIFNFLTNNAIANTSDNVNNLEKLSFKIYNQISEILNHVKLAIKKHISFDQPIILDKLDGQNKDSIYKIRPIYNTVNKFYDVYVISYPNLTSFKLYKLEDRDSKLTKTITILFDLNNIIENGEILSIDFLDDLEIVILYLDQNNSKVHLFTIYYTNYQQDYSASQIEETIGNSKKDICIKIKANSDSNIIRKRLFEGDFLPSSMIFNGRKGRRIGCLLENDLQRYMLVDIEGEPENDPEDDLENNIENE
ncbi:anaphase promoting complex subunit 4 ASCRUDRAFT_100763 [Ascoidea rubescens DSM 1968]|uniref:Anaphase-promoting complex subunit 4 n=1 Tax=Ascoidea rubescens DSM 1968 TaxID=1344418 RepID=A0A1D2VQT1_9ASCO|nr:hypothetical protein ASCRUDRAFT_100763 [Ascoidea rubescens DSM 1968]ODV63964.1 hypothetical protein ASCRUDRAFT_100763 [Ascoidea rubescens DSM 1968]